MGAGTQIRAGSAYVELFLKDNRFQSGLRNASRTLTAWGASIRSLGFQVMGLGAAVLTPLAAATKAATDLGSDLVDMSDRTGMGIEALQELGYAAEQSGSSIEALETGLVKMQRSIGDAEAGSTSAIEGLHDLGVTVSEIKDLQPDKQFELLAERIARITDPAKRAALAMKVFGKSVTDLMPMLREGAAGIEALRKRARDLGLVVSSQDARAAEQFGDELATLWKVVKIGVAQIGFALIPELSRLAKFVLKYIHVAGDWIVQNKELVSLVAKVGLGVFAIGAALTATSGIFTALGVLTQWLSGSLSLLGRGIGLLGTIAGTAFNALVAIPGLIMSGFAALPGVIAALATPIGIVSIAVVGLAAYFIYASGIIGNVVDWLQGAWTTLKDDALQAFDGIKNALAAGDFRLAAEIMWTSLKIVFTRGINALTNKWIEFKTFFNRVWTEAVYALASVFINVWFNLQQLFEQGTNFFTSCWLKFTGFITRNWFKTIGFIQKAWARLKGAITGIEATAEIERIDRETQGEVERSRKEQDLSEDAARKENERRRNQIEADRDAVLGTLDEDRQRQQDEITRKQEAEIAELEQQLEDLKRQRAELIGQADTAAKRAKLKQLDQNELDLKDRLKGVGDHVVENQARVQGTFNATAASRFGGPDSRTLKQVADATNKTATNTKGIKDKLDKGLGLKAGNS